MHNRNVNVRFLTSYSDISHLRVQLHRKMELWPCLTNRLPTHLYLLI